MNRDLIARRPATILRAEPLPARRPAAGLSAIERTVPRASYRREWRPDLWPWWVWGPLLVSPPVLVWLAYLAVCVL
jgi:hypothetical protein